MRKARKIMLPGDPLPEGSLKPRSGYYKTEEGYRSSYFGVLQEGEETMDVVPFSGPYIPRRGDKIIGKVIEIEPSMWVLDINSPYTTLLHVNDVPWRASSGDLKRVLNVGEYVYAKVMSVNEIKESWITLKDAGLRKLEGGEIVSVPASKVPRIIGREGSMVKMVRDSTFTKIIVGLNGLIWLDGIPENVIVAMEALRIIEEEAHLEGLTDRISKYLESRKGDIVGNSQ
ncbi:MAG: exosome complex RNA-binding protein Rrp4 [Candidatus Thermoplasmatota archaeon]|nr:exosome complex RNA-binding protein Rrp4 [Candidatus Thermoplasmatota archaeon]MCL5665676.1 exosome complex RNA-binding protein Rrp4 [Candidatus Thermoplasmatota archaeon]